MEKSVAPLEWGMERSVASLEWSTARSLACNVFGVNVFGVELFEQGKSPEQNVSIFSRICTFLNLFDCH